MRHNLWTAIALAAFVGALHADAVDLGVHAGYTSFAMGQVNRANAYNSGWSGVQYAQDIDSGYVVGIDETSSRLTPWNWLSVGLREEYMQSNQAENKSTAPGGNGLDYTDQATLTDALVGIKATTPFRDSNFTLGAGAWVGYGYGALEQRVHYDDGSGAVFMQGGLFGADILVGELESTISYRIGSRIGLNFTGGWRWADAPYATSHGKPLYDALQYWLNGYKLPVNVDFSGATAQGGVSLTF